jgi:RNA polymerase sigma factor (sigma-70 family)
MVRYARRATGSFESAEDLAVAVLQDLYVALLDEKKIRNQRAWTLCVLRRKIGQWRRAEARHGEILEPPEFFDRQPRDSIEREDGRDLLSELLACLSSREEEVILLRLQGMRYAEVARVLKISTNTVRTLLARALVKLTAAAVPLKRPLEMTRGAENDPSSFD